MKKMLGQPQGESKDFKSCQEALGKGQSASKEGRLIAPQRETSRLLSQFCRNSWRKKLDFFSFKYFMADEPVSRIRRAVLQARKLFGFNRPSVSMVSALSSAVETVKHESSISASVFSRIRGVPSDIGRLQRDWR